MRRAGAIAWGIVAWTAVAAAALDPSAQTPPATAVPARLRAVLDEMGRTLARFRVGGDMRTHLLMRYFDDPYVRATVACLMETEMRLRRLAVRWSGREPTEAEREQAEALLAWSGAALRRVREGTPAFELLPDRMTLRAATSRPADTPAACLGWVAYGPPGEKMEDAIRRLDRTACLGAKVYVDARTNVPAEQARRLRLRAEYGGMLYFQSAAGPTQAVADFLRPITVTELLGPKVETTTESGVIWPGTVPGGGDLDSLAWASRLAAQAAGTRLNAVGRLAMPIGGDDPVAIGRWRCALWEHALAGCRLILLSLAADRDDDPAAGDWARPWMVEATAWCGLDFLRLRDAIRAMSRPSDVAVLACFGTNDAAGRATAIARTAAICEALADAQIAADPITAAMLHDDSRMAGYRAIVTTGLESAPRETVERVRTLGERGATVIDVPDALPGPALDRFREQAARLRDEGRIAPDLVTAMTASGHLAAGLRVHSGRSDGALWVAVINRAGGSSRIILKGRARALTGAARELIEDRSVELGAAGTDVPAHAVRIYRFEAK